MKITAVISSPARNGNTAVLARAALKAAREEGAETEEIFLADHRIEFCRGCMRCMKSGWCAMNDDAMALREKLFASDGIILASPSCGIQPNARFKNFFTHRIGMYTVYTSSLGGKYFAGISTAGGVGARSVARRLAQSHAVGFFRRAYASGYLGVHRGTGRVELVQGAMARARRLGRRLVRDISRQRTYPLQLAGKRIVNRLMVSRLIRRNIEQHRYGMMRAVYENLDSRDLIGA
jgi:multimeric flavodoxin WrbA